MTKLIILNLNLLFNFSNNKFNDFGIKYLGLGLSYLIKLDQLNLNLWYLYNF